MERILGRRTRSVNKGSRPGSAHVYRMRLDRVRVYSKGLVQAFQASICAIQDAIVSDYIGCDKMHGIQEMTP